LPTTTFRIARYPYMGIYWDTREKLRYSLSWRTFKGKSSTERKVARLTFSIYYFAWSPYILHGINIDAIYELGYS
jgi:hypothetical protein